METKDTSGALGPQAKNSCTFVLGKYDLFYENLKIEGGEGGHADEKRFTRAKKGDVPLPTP